MAAKRRLAKVEGSLSAFETTLLWLEEAHAFGSLPAYVAWLIDQPIAAAPLVRVAEAAEDAVIRAMPRKSEEARAPAIRTAVRDAAFRVELVIGLNRAAQELSRPVACAAWRSSGRGGRSSRREDSGRRTPLTGRTGGPPSPSSSPSSTRPRRQGHDWRPALSTDIPPSSLMRASPGSACATGSSDSLAWVSRRPVLQKLRPGGGRHHSASSDSRQQPATESRPWLTKCSLRPERSRSRSSATPPPPRRSLSSGCEPGLAD